jgi:uncharacterized membrane-anchored protein YitT (DUF2179 family)
VLVCVIRNRQITALKRILKEYAKDSFAYMTIASEVAGKGFASS